MAINFRIETTATEGVADPVVNDPDGIRKGEVVTEPTIPNNGGPSNLGKKPPMVENLGKKATMVVENVAGVDFNTTDSQNSKVGIVILVVIGAALIGVSYYIMKKRGLFKK